MLRKYSIGLVALLLLLMFDQWTKYLAIIGLKNKHDFILIKGVLQLEYLENRGAAFGMLQNKQLPLIVITVAILFAILWIYYRIPMTKKYYLLQITLLLIASGAVGNMIDRIGRGYVVDFIYVSLIQFPIFNIADCFVVIGVVLLLFSLLFIYKEEELDILFKK